MKITWNGTGSAWATHFGNSSAVVECEGQAPAHRLRAYRAGRLREMQIYSA